VATVELSGTDAGGCLAIEAYHMNNCNTPIPYVQFDMINGTSTNFTNSTQLVTGVPLLNNGSGTINTFHLERPILVSTHIPRSLQRFKVQLLSQDGTTVSVTRCVVMMKMHSTIPAFPVSLSTLNQEALKAHGQGQ